jgi:hypothetical protein
MQADAASDDREPSATFDWTGRESATVAIVDAVAAVSGEDPREMEPLSAVVDADSLNALVESLEDRSARTDSHLEFRYGGMVVQVDATGEGRVFERA